MCFEQFLIKSTYYLSGYGAATLEITNFDEEKIVAIHYPLAVEWLASNLFDE